MKKIIILLLMLSALFSQGVEWRHDLKNASMEALKENKKIMVLMSSKSCRYCKQMHKEVFSNEAVAEFLNKNFVSVELDVNEDSYPPFLNVQGVPATFFFSADFKMRYNKILGPKHPMMFMNIAQKIASEEF